MKRLLPFLLTFGLLICSQAKPLNVLLITADDMGLQLGCYGDKEIRTPHLDELAAEGRLYENAYVAQASCSSSRSAMFTGIYPHANGQYGLLNAGVGFKLHDRLQKQTIPALVKKAGYRTGILGKLHVGDEKKFPFDMRIKSDTRDVRSVAKHAKTFLSKDGPFFLMVNYSDPHVYGRGPRPPREAFPTQYKGVPKNPVKVGEVTSFPFQRLNNDPEQVERTTQYYNAVMRFDAAVGMLLSELKKSGSYDNTLIWFVSDHGPPFFRGKTSCYEAGVKVPMILKWPGVYEAGDRHEGMVSTVDIVPTLTDALGLPTPKGVQGSSVRELETTPRTHLFTELNYHGNNPFFPRRSVRDGRFKLIHNIMAGKGQPSTGVDGDAAYRLSKDSRNKDPLRQAAFERAANPPEWELHDLKKDPWEFENLATQPQHADRLKELQKVLLQWRRETKDPLLTKEGTEMMTAFSKKKKKR